MKTITVELTEDEITVLSYLVHGANHPSACDPLKDIYEAGISSRRGYTALPKLCKKLSKAGV